MKIWIVSDLHLFHSNIIRYSGRPYICVEDMYDDLVANWNNTVAVTDIVYFLGDFRMGRHTEEIDRKIISELHGYKRMIVGNHDKNFLVYSPAGEKRYVVKEEAVVIDYWKRMGFEQVFTHPIVLDNYFILSHEPINGVNHSQIFANIHGHTHDVNMTNGNYFNACVENINYTPIDFEVIKAKFAI